MNERISAVTAYVIYFLRAHTSNCKNASENRYDESKSTKTNVPSRKCESQPTDRQITIATDWGQIHSYLTQRPHASFWDQNFSPLDLPSCWNLIMLGVCNFQTRLGGIVRCHHKIIWQSQDMSRTSTLRILGASYHDPHACLLRTYCTYYHGLHGKFLKYCTVNICTAHLSSSYITK